MIPSEYPYQTRIMIKIVIGICLLAPEWLVALRYRRGAAADHLCSRILAASSSGTCFHRNVASPSTLVLTPSQQNIAGYTRGRPEKKRGFISLRLQARRSPSISRTRLATRHLRPLPRPSCCDACCARCIVGAWRTRRSRGSFDIAAQRGAARSSCLIMQRNRSPQGHFSPSFQARCASTGRIDRNRCGTSNVPRLDTGRLLVGRGNNEIGSFGIKSE